LTTKDTSPPCYFYHLLYEDNHQNFLAIPRINGLDILDEHVMKMFRGRCIHFRRCIRSTCVHFRDNITDRADSQLVCQSHS